jgi:hypothetical protein
MHRPQVGMKQCKCLLSQSVDWSVLGTRDAQPRYLAKPPGYKIVINQDELIHNNDPRAQNGRRERGVWPSPPTWIVVFAIVAIIVGTVELTRSGNDLRIDTDKRSDPDANRIISSPPREITPSISDSVIPSLSRQPLGRR